MLLATDLLRWLDSDQFLNKLLGLFLYEIFGGYGLALVVVERFH